VFDFIGRGLNVAARFRYFSGLLHRRVSRSIIVVAFEVMGLREWGDKFVTISIPGD
jgi:hypothetical protein